MMQEKNNLIKSPNFSQQLIGEGACAKVYFLPETKETYKEFNEEYQKDPTLESRLKILKNIENPAFTFPKKLIYEDGKLIGYTMDYIEGELFQDLSNDIKFNELIKALIIFEENIMEITKKGILINDIYMENLIYGKGKITAVDTDAYFYTSNDNFSSQFKENLRDLNDSIILYFFTLKEVDKFPEEIMNDYEKLINRQGLPSRFLIKCFDYFQNNYELQIETLGDFKEAIKIMIRKR